VGGQLAEFQERRADIQQRVDPLARQQLAAGYATVAFVDLQGQLRGKTVSVGKLESALDEGIPFSADNFMLDFGDIKLVPDGYVTLDQDYHDERCDVDWLRPRVLPFEDPESDLLFFVEYAEGTNGGQWDPRRLFRRTMERAEAAGIMPTFAFEYEFRLFNESADSLRDKGFQNPKLLNEVSTYGGVMHQSLWAQLFKEMRHMCEAMDIPISSMHWEQAASMGEVALGHRPGFTPWTTRSSSRPTRRRSPLATTCCCRSWRARSPTTTARAATCTSR
jgi:glutamine synthetase